MFITKTTDNSDRVIPLIAALPFELFLDADEGEPLGSYDPHTQRTIYMGRGFSTCRYDDSAGGLFSTKSDTSRDD